MKIIYIADDGTQFDDEDECIHHEHIKGINNRVIAYAEDIRGVCPLEILAFEDIEDADIIVLRGTCQEKRNTANDIHIWTGLDIPNDIIQEDGNQIFRYNSTTGNWEDMITKAQELKTISDNLFSQINIIYDDIVRNEISNA